MPRMLPSTSSMSEVVFSSAVNVNSGALVITPALSSTCVLVVAFRNIPRASENIMLKPSLKICGGMAMQKSLREVSFPAGFKVIVFTPSPETLPRTGLPALTLNENCPATDSEALPLNTALVAWRLVPDGDFTLIRRYAHNWRKRRPVDSLCAAIIAVAGSKFPAAGICSDFIVIRSDCSASAGYTAAYGGVNVFPIVKVAVFEPEASAVSGFDTTPLTIMQSPSDQMTGYLPSVFSPRAVLVGVPSETAVKTVSVSSSGADSEHAASASIAAEIIRYVVILRVIL